MQKTKNLATIEKKIDDTGNATYWWNPEVGESITCVYMDSSDYYIRLFYNGYIIHVKKTKVISSFVEKGQITDNRPHTITYNGVKQAIGTSFEYKSYTLNTTRKL